MRRTALLLIGISLVMTFGFFMLWAPSPVELGGLPFKDSRQEFLLALKRYEKLHSDMLDGKRPAKYLTYVSNTSGWSDRVRGFLSVATVAFMTDRAFLFKDTMLDIDLAAVYAQDPIRWFAKPDAPLVHSFSVGYMRLEEELLREDTIERMRNELGNIELTMSDWAWEEIAHHPLLAEDRARLKLDDVPEWASLLFDLLFPPSPTMKNALRDYVDLVPSPRMAIHIRTGVAEGSNQFFGGSLEAYVGNHIDCFKSVVKSEGLTKVTVFLATDYEPAFDIARGLLGSMQGENFSIHVMNGSAMGNIGHLVLAHPENVHLRAHAEWEILRRAEWLFPSRSGYSLVPFGLRHVPSARAFTTNLNSAGACEEISPFGLGWFFTMEHLGQFPK